jgi:hypothetical protein
LASIGAADEAAPSTRRTNPAWEQRFLAAKPGNFARLKGTKSCLARPNVAATDATD